MYGNEINTQDELKAKRIEQNTAMLARAVGPSGTRSVRYLGGGDFIVHVFGIDEEIDDAVRTMESTLTL